MFYSSFRIVLVVFVVSSSLASSPCIYLFLSLHLYAQFPVLHWLTACTVDVVQTWAVAAFQRFEINHLNSWSENNKINVNASHIETLNIHQTKVHKSRNKNASCNLNGNEAAKEIRDRECKNECNRKILFTWNPYWCNFIFSRLVSCNSIFAFFGCALIFLLWWAWAELCSCVLLLFFSDAGFFPSAFSREQEHAHERDKYRGNMRKPRITAFQQEHTILSVGMSGELNTSHMDETLHALRFHCALYWNKNRANLKHMMNRITQAHTQNTTYQDRS